MINQVFICEQIILIKKKRYIGSSQYLRKRLYEYFNVNNLIRDNSMQICHALLKYGYDNFSLTIIDYCEPEKCIEREKYYINFFWIRVQHC